MTELCYSRVLKLEIGDKWVKHIINKNIENSRNSYHLRPSSVYRQQTSKHFALHFHCVKCVGIRSFFWSVFSHTRIEYAEIRSISPYSVRMQENTDQKKLRNWTLFTQCLHYIFFFMRSTHFIYDGPIQTRESH